MKNTLALFFILTAFWLVNSGYLKPLLLGLGLGSIIFVMVISARMKSVDGETHPLIMPTLKLPGYVLWLMWQIVLSNIDVVKRVWLGKSSIDPSLFTVKVSQKSDIAKVLHANSITLTPGTITTHIWDDTFRIHTLTQETAKVVNDGIIDKKVSRLEP